MSESVTENNDPPVIEGTEPETPSTPPPAPEAPPTGKSWAERRIQDLVAERNAERAARLAAEAKLATTPPATSEQQPPTPPTPEQPTPPTSDVERRAAELLQIQKYDETCNEVYNTGVKEYPDFTAAMAGFNDLGGLQPHLVQAIFDSAGPEIAHHLLYDLGKDKDRAYELLRLRSPFKLAVELNKMADKHRPKPAPAPVSKAPAPPEPLRAGASAPPPKEPAQMSTKEWMEWRAKQKKVR